MSFPYKSISTNINSNNLNTGSYYDQSDLDNFYSSSIVDEFFGKSEEDIIKFCIYDIEGNLQTSKQLDTKPVYNIIEKTYRDVDQKTLSYTYKEYNSGYIISFNNKILLNTLNDLSSSNIQSGNTVVSYNFLRNIGGTPIFPLIIKSISPSRKELLLVPANSFDRKDENQELIELEYQAYCQKKVLLRNITTILINRLSGYQVYSQGDSLIKNYEELFNLMRSTFGFKTNTDVLTFLNDTYVGFTKIIQGNDNQIRYDTFDGIFGYLKNWLYTYYKNIYNIDEISDEFQDIVNKATLLSLNKINSFFSSNQQIKEKIVNFITTIFYDNFIEDVINEVWTNYSNKFLGYFQNSLNFGNDILLPIINHEGYVDDTGLSHVVVKLQDFLPKSYGLRDKCWISNISIPSILQKVILNAPVVRKKYKIAGPNFNVKVNDYVVKPVNYQSINDLKSNNIVNIDFYKKLTELNVDYNNFSNFIVFSSAELRIKLFLNKYTKINTLQNYILTYATSSLSASTALSSSYAADVANYQSQIDDIYNGFDGYEVYLNNLPSASLAEPNITEYIDSAIEYDKVNPDSLTNNTPQFILVDDDNSDYLIFLSMIGHYFDNLYLYITKFPTLQYGDEVEFPNEDSAFSSGSNSYLASFANNLLEQFGWHTVSSNDSGFVDNIYLTGSNAITDDQKIKTIWNRILKNLPILYKTKGTEECIRLLSNIYGIPNNLLNIKEFGGNNLSSEDQSSYLFNQKYYLTKYQGSNESLYLPVPLPLKAVEFKFRVDTDYSFPQNVPIYLMTCYNLFWDIKLIKTTQDKCGKIVATFLTDEFIIDDIPIFDGRIYNVLLKTVSTTELFDTGSGNPSYIVFRVTCAEDDRIVFDTNKKSLLSDNLIQYFYSSSTLYVGNYTSSNTFYGNIDKINIWTEELSDAAFLDHVYNFNAYNNYSSSTTYSDLYFRYSFDYPINISGSNIEISNSNKYYNTLTASAFNFKANDYEIVNCVSQSSSVFPYQFDEVNIKQNIQYNNFGPNKYKNSKINRASETIVSRLMPTERSTYSNNNVNDSNFVGVYITPFKIRDDSLINFLGNINLMEKIGEPNEIYNDSYENLRILRNNYNLNNLSEKVLYQEFLTLYKHYFDNSFFSTTQQLFPARTKVISGIIVEPSLIERNKYQHKPIDSGLINDFNVSLTNRLYLVSGSSIEMYHDVISVPIAKNGTETTDHLNNYISNYISDDVIIDRHSIFVIGGYYTDRNNSGSLKSYVAYYRENIEKLEKNETTASKTFINYNFNLSGSNSASCDIIDTISYPKGHLISSTYRLSMDSVNKLMENSISSSVFIKSQQNINTTVNEQGILDGSLPIEITKADRDINEISLTTV